ncbi:MAG: T9SS type A sorting domain-containing protein [Ignavibacteriaceae bacterium]
MKTIIPFLFFILLLLSQKTYCQINIGDTLQFWSAAYIDWQPNPPIEQRIINAVCNEIGEQCYFFIDTEVSNQPTPQQIESLVNIYDTSFVPGLTQLYGPVPDEFDNDPRIFILIIPNEGWVGYFDPAHQMLDSTVWQIWGKHSNQKEIIYLSNDVFNYGADNVLAHEFGHMLHWGRDHSPDPPGNPVKYWEDGWVDEAFANFAPVYLIEDVTVPDVYDNQAFFAYEPDLSLINFVGGPSYNQAKLWMTFMFEHYGEENFISTFINDQANGIEGVVNALDSLGYPQSFDETFEQWIIANYLDNKTYLNGRYGYLHYNFPPCRLAASITQFPSGARTDSVMSYAVDYISFSSTIPGDIYIQFDGVDTSDFRLTFLKLGNSNSQIYSVESLSLDSLNLATFYMDSLGIDVKKIIMVVMNTDPTLGENIRASYTYSAVSIAGIEDGPDNEFTFNLYQNYPNPFNPVTKISYSIPEMSPVMIKIYDVLGNEVIALVKKEQSAGFYEVEFSATGGATSLPSGIYFYSLTAGIFTETRKMVLMR